MATKVRKRPRPDANGAETGKPIPTERYPLAIVIDHATWRRWQQFKAVHAVQRDRTAFTRLLAMATAEGLFPEE